MRHWSEPKRAKARVEIIPMIDVMMFLLVFFVLISINVIPALGLKTNLPKSSQTQELIAPVRVIVTLAKDGSLLIDGVTVRLDQVSANLRDKQKSSKKKLAIIINGDEAVSMQRLIDVIDVLKDGGFDALSIAAQKKSPL
jgi:biopolymer transport protein ExbD